VLDLYPYATTGPIHLKVGGRPVRSREDAEFFMVWIDRTRVAVERHRDWNTEAERKEVLDMLTRARAEYERRAGE
jgi:TolB protein